MEFKVRLLSWLRLHSTGIYGSIEIDSKYLCTFLRREQGEHLAESCGVPFFEVSAKNGAGVHEAFLHLGKTILEAR